MIVRRRSLTNAIIFLEITYLALKHTEVAILTLQGHVTTSVK